MIIIGIVLNIVIGLVNNCFGWLVIVILIGGYLIGLNLIGLLIIFFYLNCLVIVKVEDIIIFIIIVKFVIFNKYNLLVIL